MVMETVLVTGGCGFIGSNFIKHLLRQHADLRIINYDNLTYSGNLDNLAGLLKYPRHRFVKGDIRDNELVISTMKKTSSVVHFAAETHVDRSNCNAEIFIDTNIYGTYVLLEAAKKCKIRRFIQISTDDVYGNTKNRLSNESDRLDTNSPYAASKAAGEHLAYSYYATHGVPVIITRGTNNYGPYQYPEKLVPLFITNAIDNLPLPVYGDGGNVRDWLYVEDHCIAIAALLFANDQCLGETLNIGANCEKSVLEMARLVLKCLNKPFSLIKHVKDRNANMRCNAINAKKINMMVGWKHKYDFLDSFEMTVEWYVKNEQWWRKIKDNNIGFKLWYQANYEER